MITLLLALGCLNANTINVPGSVATIQGAIDIARVGDTILVDRGIYYENIDYLGKEIVLISSHGPEMTTIDGSSNGPVVLMMNGESPAATLEGFSIQHGTGFQNTPTTTFGGGICIRYDSSPTIRDCIVRDNMVIGIEASGGGIGVSTGSTSLIEDVILEGNNAYHGGGLYGYFASPTIRNVIARNNLATGSGGGMGFHSSRPILHKLLIYDNATANGGGGGLWFHLDSYAVVNQVTVVGNNAGSENIAGGGFLMTSSDTVYIANSIFRENTPNQIGSYVTAIYTPGLIGMANSDIEGGSWNLDLADQELLFYMDNIDEDPLFVDEANTDFNLLEDSPCVNTGTACLLGFLDTLLWMPDSCYCGSAPDMGAFESVFGMVPVMTHPQRPARVALLPPYPNPFNQSTIINFQVDMERVATVTIYDLYGHQILSPQLQPARVGLNRFSWNGTNNAGEQVQSGIYFCQLRIGSEIHTQKMSLIR